MTTEAEERSAWPQRAAYEAAAGTATEYDNPFVYFRRKEAYEPTVAFNEEGGK